jgi:adenylate kinase family enzyme
MKKIVFVGGPGSGKSTISAEVFVELKKRGANVELVTEWIRQDLWINGPMTTIWEQFRTYAKQREIEDSVPTTVDWVVTDSGTLTPYFYAIEYCDQKDPRQRLVLHEMYNRLVTDIFTNRYTHIFYLPTTETYKRNSNILSDGTRFQTLEQANKLDQNMRSTFCEMIKNDSVYTVDVPLEERSQFVLDKLGFGTQK